MQYKELVERKFEEWGTKTRLTRLLMDVVNGYQMFMAEKLKPFELGLSEYPLIIYLYHGSTPDTQFSQIDLARNLKRDKALIARAVTSLVKKGYLKSTVNSQRKNTNNITLTPEGYELAPKIMEIINEWEESVLYPASDGPGEFLDHLKSLCDRAENYYKKTE